MYCGTNPSALNVKPAPLSSLTQDTPVSSWMLHRNRATISVLLNGNTLAGLGARELRFVHGGEVGVALWLDDDRVRRRLLTRGIGHRVRGACNAHSAATRGLAASFVAGQYRALPAAAGRGEVVAGLVTWMRHVVEGVGQVGAVGGR